MSAPVTPAPETVSSSQPALSEPQRIINMFYAPTRTFEDIKRNAQWWAPFLILLACSAAFIYVVQTKIGFDQIAENIKGTMSETAKDRLEKAPPEARANFEKNFPKQIKDGTYRFPIVALVFNLIAAAVLMGTFSFGFGTKVRYWQSMAILYYAGIPRVIWIALTLITIYAGADPGAFMLDNPFPSNPGFLMNPADGPGLYRLVSTGLDFFNWWTIVLAGMGYATIAGTKKMNAIIAVAVWFLLFTCLRAGLSVLAGFPV
jgi:hypothetical protein